MSLGRMLLGGASSAMMLKTIADEAAGANPLGWQLGASITAAMYGISADRSGLGASVYCGLATANEMINHGDPLWWGIGTVFFAGIYGLSDSPQVVTIVKKVKEYIYKNSSKEPSSEAAPLSYLPPDEPDESGYAMASSHRRETEFIDEEENVTDKRPPKRELVLLENR